MKITHCDGPLGAEIDGLDLRRTYTGDVIHQIRDLVHRRGVVAIRGQELTPEQQIAFAQYFGDPEEHVLSKFLAAGHPELLVVSNIIENGRQIGLVDAGSDWHTDLSYMKRPTYLSMLYSIEVPAEDGRSLGDTQFVSTSHAYETLDDQAKSRIHGKRAVHSYAARSLARQAAGSKRPPPSAEELDRTKDVSHPIVREHPASGKGCLFVNQAYTTLVEGLNKDASSELLASLYRHITRPESIHRHKWRVGDLVIWDNIQTQHLATFDYKPEQRRLMHRVSLQGPAPIPL